MPKKDDQLIKASDLRQGKFSNGLSTQDIQIWANGYKIAYVSWTFLNFLSQTLSKFLK